MLGANKGVCRDDAVGGQDNFQLHTFGRDDGIQTITFRRSLISCKFFFNKEANALTLESFISFS